MTGDWRSSLRRLDVEDDGDGYRAQVVEELVDAALTAAANPYSRGWFKADDPLEDGAYWWRYVDMPDMEPGVVHVRYGEVVSGLRRIKRGEWEFASGIVFCGPIPEPPADPLPDAAAGAQDAPGRAGGVGEV